MLICVRYFRQNGEGTAARVLRVALLKQIFSVEIPYVLEPGIGILGLIIIFVGDCNAERLKPAFDFLELSRHCPILS
jgi:hypothetical protein